MVKLKQYYKIQNVRKKNKNIGETLQRKVYVFGVDIVIYKDINKDRNSSSNIVVAINKDKFGQFSLCGSPFGHSGASNYRSVA